MTIYHKHHIIPKHVWKKKYGNLTGINIPSNIELLTIQEHANIHYERWVLVGDIEDWIAWKCLGGQANEPEVWKAKSLLGSNNRLGKHNTSSHNQNISKGLTGRTISSDTRKKQAIARKNSKPNNPKGINGGHDFLSSFGKTLIGPKNPFYGKHHTTQSKELNRQKHTKHWVFTDPNGVEYFESNFDNFCKQHHIWDRGLKKVLRGEIENYKGWKVKPDPNYVKHQFYK